MLKEMDFYHSEKNYLTNRIKKVAATSGEFTGNIIPDKTVKPKPKKELKS